MDPNSWENSDWINSFKYYDENFLPNSDQYPDLGFDIPSTGNFDHNPYFSSDPYPSDLTQSLIWTPPQEDLSPTNDENDSSDPVLKYVSQILMEENMEEDKPFLLHDALALQQTEEMLNQVIGESQAQSNSPHDSVASGGSSDFGGTTNSYSSTSPSTDVSNFVDSQESIEAFGGSDSGSNLASLNGLPGLSDGLVGSSVNELMIQKMFGDTESVLQFKKGLEEASKFLPSSDQLNITNLEAKKSSPTGEPKEVSAALSVKGSSRGRKGHKREEADFGEIRSNKQMAGNVEVVELTDMFDKVLLIEGVCKPVSNPWKTFPDGKVPAETQGNRKTKKKKEKKEKTVDFHNLLILCAQAVSAGDKNTAHDLLKQIRELSDPLGDASHRLAHCFANGLEARLIGSTGRGFQSSYNHITSKKTSAADILKTYKVYLSAIPFKTFVYFFANKMILKAAQNASILHIVDFGILYGFQWPMLIQHIAKREGGPPKLRFTGIELPQCGFRPTARIEETGRRLARYCERFGVPFEYNAVASQNWENICIDDLKIRRNETLAVNCTNRLKNFLDETANGENCPRNSILKLIREMNPDIFVNAVVNGSYNAPFFLNRFKEALFHFSALFDIFERTLARENQERLKVETELYGKEVMNVVACEGLERVERPETYKQWQVRMARVGFKQMKLDRELVQKFRDILKMWYHKDFMMDEDGEWFLQGWKGRILYASACWVPA